MIGLSVVFLLMIGSILILNQMIDQEISRSSDFSAGLNASNEQVVTYSVKKKAPAAEMNLHSADQKDISAETKNNGIKDVKARKQPRPRYETPLDDVELAL